MAISKITLNGVTQMDVTGKTVTAASMLSPVTALKNDGTDITGSIQSVAGDLIVSDECDDLLEGLRKYNSGSLNNAYYSWSDGVCTVTTPNGAVTSAGSIYNILQTSPGTLPSTVSPGEQYYVTVQTTSENVRLRFTFRDSGGNNISPDVVFTANGIVTVPANAASWMIQIHVPPNTLLTQVATIGNIHFYTMVTAVPANRYTERDVIVAVASSEYVGSDVPKNDSDDLTVSGDTVTAQAGYYSAAASASVASGTAGTPTAAKGTVSNHAISITPSVTNATGYITGGTKTGTTVTVSASELVSGTKSITSSGTTDVTNYASASVAAGSVTAPSTISGTGANINVGQNTLSLGKTISVTPTVTTAGYITSGTAKNVTVSLSASVNVRHSSDLTADGATVTAPAGYYASDASKTVATGTAGTPTVTKGAVSNNSITVTPSVTNTTGYITGGTIAGTGVSVVASELVSGSNTLLMNGTFDVTNLASIITSFPSGFDYEGGEFTPATDEATHNISFLKTHYGLPFMAMVIDKDGYDSTADTNHSMVFFDWQDIFSNGIYSTSSAIMMGEVLARYRTTTNALATKNYTLWYSVANQTDTATQYPRYWVTETGMKAEVGSTSYWRASRAYKWFAAWKPTLMPSWELGAIDENTGYNYSSQNRIRTSTYIKATSSDRYIQVYVPEGAGITILGWDSNYTFVPMSSSWLTGTVYVNISISSSVSYMKIMARYTDDSAISDVQTLAKNIIIRGAE